MEECPIITLGIPSPKLMVQAKVWRATWVVKGKLQPRAKPTPFRNWLYFWLEVM